MSVRLNPYRSGSVLIVSKSFSRFFEEFGVNSSTVLGVMFYVKTWLMSYDRDRFDRIDQGTWDVPPCWAPCELLGVLPHDVNMAIDPEKGHKSPRMSVRLNPYRSRSIQGTWDVPQCWAPCELFWGFHLEWPGPKVFKYLFASL